MTQRRTALGRGLSALIPETTEPSRDKRGLFNCPIERIVPQKGQPRRIFNDEKLNELSASIKEQGIVQPLVVRAIGGDKYVLIAGERRWRAAQRAGLHEVPVVIRDVDDTKAFEMALVENIQREDLNPVEEAEALAHLLDAHGYTQQQLATRVGKDRSTVANSLRLLALPTVAKEALASGDISGGHARALLGLSRAADIQRVLKQILAKSLSVRQTEALVQRLRSEANNADSDTNQPAAPAKSSNVKHLEERLARSLGTRVQIDSRQGNKGSIAISYNSLDELERLLEVLLR